jgi:hypothetical protein
MAHRLTITIPDSLYTALAEAAKRDYRSLSQEIIYLLEKFTPVSASQQSPGGLHYPPGVRSPENPTGQSYTPTNDTHHIIRTIQ